MVTLEYAYWLAFAVFLGFGAYSMRHGSRGRLNVLFASQCIALGLWNLAFALGTTAGDAGRAARWFSLGLTVSLLVPVLAIELARSIRGRTPKGRRWSNIPWYLVAAVLGYSILDANRLTDVPGAVAYSGAWVPWLESTHPWVLAYLAFFLISLGVAAAHMLGAIRWNPSVNRRGQARVMLGAILLAGLFGVVMDAIPTIRGIPNPNTASLSAMIWVLALWYAVDRYHMMGNLPPVSAEDILGTMDEMVVVISADGRIRRTNAAVTRHTGYRREDLINQHWEAITNADSWLAPYLEHVYRGERISGKSGQLVTADGRSLAVSLSAKPLDDEYGELLGAVCIFKDVEATQRAFRAIQTQRHYLEALFRGNRDAIVLWDHHMRVLDINEAFTDLFGFTLEEIKGRDLVNLMVPEERWSEGEPVISDLLRGEDATIETVRLHKDGSTIPVSLRSIPVMIDGERVAVYGVYTDISRRKAHEQYLRYLSLRDGLTGVYNRTHFDAEVGRMQQSVRGPVSILLVDVDGLKMINDSLGHEMGDVIIQQCADLLERSKRHSDVLARVGGDEFALILPDTDEDGAEQVKSRIHATLAEISDDAGGLTPEISLGTATSHDPGVPLMDVYRAADDAMYRQKQERRNLARENIARAIELYRRRPGVHTEAGEH